MKHWEKALCRTNIVSNHMRPSPLPWTLLLISVDLMFLFFIFASGLFFVYMIPRDKQTFSKIFLPEPWVRLAEKH